MESLIESLQKKIKQYIKKSDNIYVPINDPLTYKLLELKNRMKILLIKDPDTNISSATMHVGVGHVDNPPDALGMAHYLEHMLFMGSDMYQGCTFFQCQVSGSGGMTNAFTTNKHTQYFFDIASNNADGDKNFIDILRIFSRFFIKPLFELKYVVKEVSAVDSEHKKNIGSDDWRMMNLAKKFLIDPVNSKFSTGTKETLLGSSDNDPTILRNKLLDFYGKHYSSDRMMLIIAHKNISDDFVATVQKMFDEVPLKQTSVTDDTMRVREIEGMYELIKFKKNTENNELVIKWLLDGTEQYENNLLVDGFNILSYILGHEGRNSLYDILKNSQLIIDLATGIEHNSDSNCVFSIHMGLTLKGYENWESILYIINCYIENLCNLNKSYEKLFGTFSEEIEDLNFLSLRSIEKQDGLSVAQFFAECHDRRKIAPNLLPIANVLYGSTSIRKKNFTNSLNMLKFERMKVIIGSSHFNDHDVPLVDDYYGTRYNHIDRTIDLKMIDYYKTLFTSSNTDSKMRHPKYNNYIKYLENINIINPIEQNAEGYCMLHSENNNIYYIKKGNCFQTYKIYGIISISLESMRGTDPDVYATILMYLLYIRTIKNAEIYMLGVAQSSISINLSKDELLIHVSTYSKDIEIIFEEVMSWYFIISKETDMIDKEIYKVIYHDMIVQLSNYNYSDPYSMVVPEFIKMINPDHTISNDQLLEAVKKLSPENMENSKTINYNNFRKKSIELMTTGRTTGIFGGSIGVRQADNLIRLIDTTFKKPKGKGQLVKYNITIDQNKPNKMIKINANPDNTEFAIGYGLYIGNLKEIYNNIDGCDLKCPNNIIQDASSEMGDMIDDQSEEPIGVMEWMIRRPMANILERYISEKFSSLIRTEREIGYIATASLVNASLTNNPEVFLLFIVQSTRNDLENVVREYVDKNLLDDVLKMTEEEFDLIKYSLITKLSENTHNIGEEIEEKYFSLKMRTKEYKCMEFFDRKKMMIEGLRSIKGLRQFVEFVKEILDRNQYFVQLINISNAKN